jgi:hypothetical protein
VGDLHRSVVRTYGVADMGHSKGLENRTAHFLAQLPVVAIAHLEAQIVSCILIRCRHNMIESW